MSALLNYQHLTRQQLRTPHAGIAAATGRPATIPQQHQTPQATAPARQPAQHMRGRCACLCARAFRCCG